MKGKLGCYLDLDEHLALGVTIAWYPGFTHHVTWAALWDFMTAFQSGGVKAWDAFVGWKAGQWRTRWSLAESSCGFVRRGFTDGPAYVRRPSTVGSTIDGGVARARRPTEGFCRKVRPPSQLPCDGTGNSSRASESTISLTTSGFSEGARTRAVIR